MGVVFFSSLAMACGGVFVKRAWGRRKVLKRYANRIAKIIEANLEIQAYFRENPKEIVVRERLLGGKPVCIELMFLPDENIIDVAVSEPGTLSNYCPVSAWAVCRDPSCR